MSRFCGSGFRSVTNISFQTSDNYSWFPETCPRLFGPVKATIEVDGVKEIFVENKLDKYFNMPLPA